MRLLPLLLVVGIVVPYRNIENTLIHSQYKVTHLGFDNTVMFICI